MTDGSMNAEYARGRRQRKELIYRYRFRAAAALSAAPGMRGGRLLDLGAAEGLTLLEMIRKANPRYAVGVELSGDLVKEATLLDAPVIHGDICRLPEHLRRGEFDVVTALAVLEHLPDPQQALVHAYEALAPGGRLVASAPCPFWDELAGRTGIHREKVHHVQDVTGDTFRVWALAAGFRKIRTRPFMFVGTAFLPYLKILPSAEWCFRMEKPFANRLFSPFFINQLFIADR